MANNPEQTVRSLAHPVVAIESVKPLFIRTYIPAPAFLQEGGTSAASLKLEEYVLLSALPADLKDRVVTFIKAAIR